MADVVENDALYTAFLFTPTASNPDARGVHLELHGLRSAHFRLAPKNVQDARSQLWKAEEGCSWLCSVEGIGRAQDGVHIRMREAVGRVLVAKSLIIGSQEGENLLVLGGRKRHPRLVI